MKAAEDAEGKILQLAVSEKELAEILAELSRYRLVPNVSQLSRLNLCEAKYRELYLAIHGSEPPLSPVKKNRAAFIRQARRALRSDPVVTDARQQVLQ